MSWSGPFPTPIRCWHATAHTATTSASTSAMRFSRSTVRAVSLCSSSSPVKTLDGAHRNDAIHNHSQGQAEETQNQAAGGAQQDRGRSSRHSYCDCLGDRRLLLRKDSVHQRQVQLRRLLR